MKLNKNHKLLHRFSLFTFRFVITKNDIVLDYSVPPPQSAMKQSSSMNRNTCSNGIIFVLTRRAVLNCIYVNYMAGRFFLSQLTCRRRIFIGSVTSFDQRICEKLDSNFLLQLFEHINVRFFAELFFIFVVVFDKRWTVIRNKGTFNFGWVEFFFSYGNDETMSYTNNLPMIISVQFNYKSTFRWLGRNNWFMPCS